MLEGVLCDSTQNFWLPQKLLEASCMQANVTALCSLVPCFGLIWLSSFFLLIVYQLFLGLSAVDWICHFDRWTQDARVETAGSAFPAVVQGLAKQQPGTSTHFGLWQRRRLDKQLVHDCGHMAFGQSCVAIASSSQLFIPVWAPSKAQIQFRRIDTVPHTPSTPLRQSCFRVTTLPNPSALLSHQHRPQYMLIIEEHTHSRQTRDASVLGTQSLPYAAANS